ncbi:FixH family protein [Alkalicoccobacillus murimartini]|uniref:YtkA-like domain-containing protein n=1 Tax=Alkalicoccobacillus murimartini TaxID=171685 RepID=A0ABT9YGB5_9BACI|nr:FixH family protein [Alkalicoccobacillus murimartini]MDQ0206520.1 hypothetical protein [Alkalicoccobacillus murimartini]
MKKALLVFSFVALFMIASCAIGQNQSDQRQLDTLDSLQADLSAPSETALHEMITLSVRVTFGDEAVTDAKDVDFEIWRNGERDSGSTIAAETSGSGVYTVETSFKEDGIYHVQAHVSLEDNDITSSQRVIAGDVSESDLEAAEQEFQQELDQEEAQESNSN